MFDLVLQSGKRQGSRLILPLDKVIVVGRDPECQLTLASSLVSRQHCQLRQAAEGIWVTDLESQNGTYLNDVAVTTPTVMVAGDYLRIGPCVFEAQPHQPPVPKPQPIARPSGTTAKPKSAVRGKLPESSGLSDDEIAVLLSDGDTSTELPVVPSGDTTIIRGRNTPPPSPGESASSPAVERPTPTPSAAPTQPAIPSAPLPRTPRTLKEQAAEIFRRHRAKLQGESTEGE